MAYVWHMSATFADEESAERFRGLFNVNPFRVPSGRTVSLSASVEKLDEWECHVVPGADGGHLNGHGGPADDSEAADLAEAGAVLYRRLRHAPSFLWALCGVEVGDWLSRDELLGRAADLVERPEAYHGLVLSDAVHELVGRPPAFVQFGDGAVWIPWRGPRED
jgi:hypothetical protein